MNNISQLPDNDASYECASQWIVKLDRGLSPDEKIALPEWMHADPQNLASLMQMTKLWDKMEAMSRLSDLFAKPAAHSEKQNKRRWQAYPAIAASFVLASIICLWAAISVDLNFGNAPGDNSYQTAIGEQSNVILSDGTQLTLNTNTSVKVSYTDQRRLIHLSHGEIHVSVAKDPRRPLSVIAANKIVQAIGTEFNIEITDQQKIELVVTEGKVKVGVQQTAPKDERNSTSPMVIADAKTVSAGEEIMLGTRNEQITQVSPDDIAVRLSWRSGNLIFRGESLEEAVKEVGRYTSVEFVFMSEDLKKMRVAGLFKAGDVEGLLATLRENFDIVSHRDGQGKVLLSTNK